MGEIKMGTTMQCENCGNIFVARDTETETVPDISGGTIEKGICPACGGDAWEIK